MLFDDWRVHALESTTVVFFVPPWLGHTTPPAYDAFVSLAADKQAVQELRPRLREWIERGSGSAQIYAAVLLGILDKDEGRAAMDALADSSANVRIHLGPGGTTQTSTVGAVVRALATGLGPVALSGVRT